MAVGINRSLIRRLTLSLSFSLQFSFLFYLLSLSLSSNLWQQRENRWSAELTSGRLHDRSENTRKCIKEGRLITFGKFDSWIPSRWSATGHYIERSLSALMISQATWYTSVDHVLFSIPSLFFPFFEYNEISSFLTVKIILTILTIHPSFSGKKRRFLSKSILLKHCSFKAFGSIYT